jgi:hypothetical protein
VYSWCAPEWICQAHFPHQLPGFRINPGTPAWSALPPPVVTKSLTMPANHCRRLHYAQDIRPARPESSQRHKKRRSESVECGRGEWYFRVANCCRNTKSSSASPQRGMWLGGARQFPDSRNMWANTLGEFTIQVRAGEVILSVSLAPQTPVEPGKQCTENSRVRNSTLHFMPECDDSMALEQET